MCMMRLWERQRGDVGRPGMIVVVETAHRD